jgi:hypothetical protein
MVEDKRCCPHCGEPLHERPYLMSARSGSLSTRAIAWAVVAVALLVVLALGAARF